MAFKKIKKKLGKTSDGSTPTNQELYSRVKSEVYPDLPNGSWVASFHVQDEDYWNDVILSDSFTGVSLEGSFDMVETKLSSHLDKGEKLFNELKEIANSGENPVLVEQKLREKLNIE